MDVNPFICNVGACAVSATRHELMKIVAKKENFFDIEKTLIFKLLSHSKKPRKIYQYFPRFLMKFN
jgi:hypothetical protein